MHGRLFEISAFGGRRLHLPGAICETKQGAVSIIIHDQHILRI